MLLSLRQYNRLKKKEYHFCTVCKVLDNINQLDHKVLSLDEAVEQNYIILYSEDLWEKNENRVS